MKKIEWKKWLGVAGRMLLAYALVFAQGALAAQNQTTKDKAGLQQKAVSQKPGEKQSAAASTAKARVEETQGEESDGTVTREKSSDGRREGIKVHGHWTIEVHNQDGTLISHREFENSLVQGPGNGSLAFLLTRGGTAGGWLISVAGICNGDCSIAEAASGIPATSKNLIVGITGTNFGVTLSGTVMAGINGQVTQVATKVGLCPPSIAAGACVASIPSQTDANAQILGFFTAANPSTVSVSTGQTVSVTVTFTFS